jgi:hypothetical protein
MLELHRRGEVVHLTPQVFIEFRNVATRPLVLNGLGLSITKAEAEAAGFEAKFSLLTETPDIYPVWKALVTALGVIGKHPRCSWGCCLPCPQNHALAHVQCFSLRSHGGMRSQSVQAIE